MKTKKNNDGPSKVGKKQNPSKGICRGLTFSPLTQNSIYHWGMKCQEFQGSPGVVVMGDDSC